MQNVVFFDESEWYIKYQGQGFVILLIGTLFNIYDNNSFSQELLITMEKEVYYKLFTYKYFSIIKDNTVFIIDENDNIIKICKPKFL